MPGAERPFRMTSKEVSLCARRSTFHTVPRPTLSLRHTVRHLRPRPAAQGRNLVPDSLRPRPAKKPARLLRVGAALFCRIGLAISGYDLRILPGLLRPSRRRRIAVRGRGTRHPHPILRLRPREHLRGFGGGTVLSRAGRVLVDQALGLLGGQLAAEPGVLGAPPAGVERWS